DASELFHEGQRRHIAFGEVQTVAQVAGNPQFAHRGSFRPVEGFQGVRVPGPYACFNGTPSPAAAPPAAGPSTVAEVAADWARIERPGPTPDALRHRGPTSAGKPLDGIRVVDFTWVLAGPYGNRVLGDLGADVLKFQTAERATLVNSPDY